MSLETLGWHIRILQIFFIVHADFTVKCVAIDLNMVKCVLKFVPFFCQKYLFEDISIHSITSSVVLLLRMCSGHCPSSLLHINTFTYLIGCCKVQRCGLDTLGALSVYEGEAVIMMLHHKCKRYPYQYTQYFCINTLNKLVDT